MDTERLKQVAQQVRIEIIKSIYKARSGSSIEDKTDRENVLKQDFVSERPNER
ncbi:MAG: hypothetical protein ACOX8Q_08640 [Christensenellales bacterium]